MWVILRNLLRIDNQDECSKCSIPKVQNLGSKYSEAETGPCERGCFIWRRFRFCAQRNFRYCFWLCIAFLRNWPKILEPFSHDKLHRSKIKIHFTSFTLFSRPLRWLHVSWAPKPHWFIMYCAYRNWSLDERFCLKPIYYWRIIWNSLNRIQ